VKISIQDSGVGIPPNILDKIFDPYFSTKREGSGLGLAICQSIINKHDGNIFVESFPGKGTRFTIYLPVAEKQPMISQKEMELFKGDICTKILVMDDEKIVRNVAKAMLVKLGNEVVVAKDGAEAIRLYKEAMNSDDPMRLVIMDLTIPGGMGGQEAVREILTLNPEAKVIVSSGYSNDPVMANFENYGFCAAIIKPFQLEELASTLHKVMQ
jgi:CheY-like chemotaxis protein